MRTELQNLLRKRDAQRKQLATTQAQVNKARANERAAAAALKPHKMTPEQIRQRSVENGTRAYKLRQEGRSYREIGEILGISTKAAEKRVGHGTYLARRQLLNNPS